MPIYQLDPAHPTLFPPIHLANADSPAALGGDLTIERLVAAYHQGYFPWYNEPPILWWNPDPRFVLFPDQLKVSKSMRPYFNQRKYRVTYDQQFSTVLHNCRATPRRGQQGSWIDDDIAQAYANLYKAGYAHSVEVYDRQDQLIGGLYGIALGRVFFGESMFAHARDASKFGFIALVRRLKQRGYFLVDCQQETAHLKSLGAEAIDRAIFAGYLAKINL
ncbi:MAG: leucyl/phenylalanyl-tRNA--protein transferase, partial [Bacteroidota bacterium]